MSGRWWPRRLPGPVAVTCEAGPTGFGLARAFAMAGIRVPTVAEEDVRDLARAREAIRGDLMRARHRLSKLLLRPDHGIVYDGGKTWNGMHE
jgi:transposase